MGAVFGTGEGRGAALVLGGVGAILAVSGIWLGASRLRQVFLAQVPSGAADATAATAASPVPSP